MQSLTLALPIILAACVGTQTTESTKCLGKCDIIVEDSAERTREVDPVLTEGGPRRTREVAPVFSCSTASTGDPAFPRDQITCRFTGFDTPPDFVVHRLSATSEEFTFDFIPSDSDPLHGGVRTATLLPGDYPLHVRVRAAVQLVRSTGSVVALANGEVLTALTWDFTLVGPESPLAVHMPLQFWGVRVEVSGEADLFEGRVDPYVLDLGSAQAEVLAPATGTVLRSSELRVSPYSFAAVEAPVFFPVTDAVSTLTGTGRSFKRGTIFAAGQEAEFAFTLTGSGTYEASMNGLALAASPTEPAPAPEPAPTPEPTPAPEPMPTPEPTPDPDPTCGGAEQLCCGGYNGTCDPGAYCTGSRCAACGNAEQLCCGGYAGTCNAGAYCAGSRCAACGESGQACCSGYGGTCNAGAYCAGSRCAACGESGQACCGGYGGTCNPGLTCSGTRCG